MGQVGFGAYRISNRSAIHKKALIKALELGCPLIDTSANYTNGESESLIGEVLSEHPKFNPQLVTKAGYVQGSNLAELEKLNALGLALEDLVDLGEQLKHSIHPEFLENQLDQSLIRLKRKSIDFFLLHNPEYYFKIQNANQEEYYARIEKAFIYLESEVTRGRIKAYGISSNNFILPLNDPHVTNLSQILKVAQKINPQHHFKIIQFPFNLIEIGALEKFGDYGNENLIELAKLNNLITMSNRPLNAFTNNQLVRLATYEEQTKDLDLDVAEKNFNFCLNLIKEKWIEASKEDELVDSDDFEELTLIKQFREIWKMLPTTDAVEQVYHGHIFPFIARIWGNGGLNALESAPFYQMYEHSLLYSRINMTKKALDFKNQAQSLGLIAKDNNREFALEVVETYLDYGIDFVLVGMKNPTYVDQLSPLFKV